MQSVYACYVPIFVSGAISKEWNFIWSSWTTCCRTKWNFLMIIYTVFQVFKYEVVHKVKGVDDQTWAPLYVLTLLTLFTVNDTDGWMWPFYMLTLKTLCRKHIRTQLFSFRTNIWPIVMVGHKWVTLWTTPVKTVTVSKLANHTGFDVFTVFLLRIQGILDVVLYFYVMVPSIWKNLGAFIFKG